MIHRRGGDYEIDFKLPTRGETRYGCSQPPRPSASSNGASTPLSWLFSAVSEARLDGAHVSTGLAAARKLTPRVCVRRPGAWPLADSIQTRSDVSSRALTLTVTRARQFQGIEGTLIGLAFPSWPRERVEAITTMENTLLR